MLLPPGACPTHFLYPCAIFAHREEHVVTTILGSCVAVCLLDPVSGIGGINHYMLPLWNGDGLPTPRFGNVAIDKLIERMRFLGANRARLVAKVFGGAKVIASEMPHFCVGDRNVMVAMEMLEDYGIPVVAQSVGGMQGMKIFFNTRTGQVDATWLASRAPEGGRKA